MIPLPYSIEKAPGFEKALRKLASLNPEFGKAFENKLIQVLEEPHRFKPLGNQLHGFRRVHLMRSFVLIYEIIEAEKSVRLIRIEHHDKAYKI